MSEIMIQNLLSPVVLFFILGIIAALVKSDLIFPKGLSEGLSIYLLIAIGLKGGIELSHYSLQDVLYPMMGTLFLGIIIPILALVFLKFMGLDFKNSIGLAATYGSVSIVTYAAAITFLEKINTSYEPYMNALVVLLESPAIIVSILLFHIMEKNKDVLQTSSARTGIIPSSLQLIDTSVIKESLFGKSILLLVGSLLIGLLVGERAIPTVKPLFFDLYHSALILFLLNMGIMAGQRLPEVSKHGYKLIIFGIVMPIICGTIGVFVGEIVGLSIGGMTLMGVLAGSASYIAAPAALRTSIPDANPSIYLGLALGITFPFNLLLGISLYYNIAAWIH
ncbi:hypothetical protein HNQ94_000276 [Salirhabdus euzebyi]|uniref:Sodium-dependent bicarbonate transport family permease n=1 Tax=Salirhabdus euzebyi TaxID=394506 RepID=A0A841Q1S5_9BACI|nr:sodium-dependent bicarbonate transport family permease [Salirhabdus euzebyi]MBB6451855.1 hypothetical protein [Salirhabdus euzebyi]